MALCPIQGREEKEITADTKESLPLMNADERGFEEPFYHKGHKGTRRTNKRERQGRMITDSKRPIRQ